MRTVGHSNLNLGAMPGSRAGAYGLGYHDPVYSDDPAAPQGTAVIIPDVDNTGLYVLAALVLFVVWSQ